VNERYIGSGTEPAPVQVCVRRHPTGKSVVCISGELLYGATADMARVINEELSRVPALLALDLSSVTGIDGAGISTLASAAALAAESDISFCLVGVHGRPVGAALADADLVELFEIFPSVSDA
jgi:anti-sigma B factor antagonist